MTARTGRWHVTTFSGSLYVLDFDAMTVERSPGAEANPLRQDGYECPLLEVVTLEEGVYMELVVDVRGDGIKTYRRTTAVESIKELVDA